MKALIAAGGGVGDIVRTSPLIRAMSKMGWHVDVLFSPEYPEAITLYEGTPEIGRIFHFPVPGDRYPLFGGRLWDTQETPRFERLVPETYDLAVIKSRNPHVKRHVKEIVRASRFIWPSKTAVLEGDSYFITRVAAKLGWNGAMPPPFVLDSGRDFNLPPGAVAIHPGCNPIRHWKKWHGFAELARMFEHVAVIGSTDDEQIDRTYFGEPFAWPEHVIDFTGRLSLLDTASLLRQCRLLVSNDSGLMHLAVAAGTLTFGIFGITSQRREAMPVPHMHAITKGLACEPACREQPLFRKDCDFHLECMKTLTAAEVYQRIVEILPPLRSNYPGLKNQFSRSVIC
ncbi:MAG: glycosyltransferase family 9 protein [Bryobacteraceae bacterium]